MNKWTKTLGRGVSYILVAAIASAVTLALWGQKYSKLLELESVIDRRFIGQADVSKMEDAAAAAMIAALGDKWSYYISAEDFAAHQENKDNAYVGIGITITAREDGTGLDIIEVTPGGSAQEGGVLPGDVLIHVEDRPIAGMSTDEVKDIVRGEAGTQVTLGILRGQETKSFTLERREIRVTVATGKLLDGNIGWIRISNFNTNCAKETIAAIEALQKQGADKLIFDVRNNPGGYVREMIEVLDYLLPEGVLYRDVDYRGVEGEERSDGDRLELPMAVLVNENSYSAAEFFAACLDEYDWATVVGEHTTGKGHYQNTIKLSDGSAVNLSTGKYFTPSGKNLTEEGGVTPDVQVSVDKATAAAIYSQTIADADDPQLQAAVKALTETGS